ncbi:MAG: ABC transporter substrate-binding protein [Alphaproteobacteria bacterium]|nr:ABC transporter substrate-binding protein [Alphaproteobacteria bacterium]
MRRREFNSWLGMAAPVWTSAAAAQTADRVHRVGVLAYWAADDVEGRGRLAALREALEHLGWRDGRNLRIETRWASGDDVRRHAAELASSAPDILVAATGSATVAPLLQATRTIPIVFVTVIDPVGAGFVTNLARPGGNATGFTNYEYGMSGKWLELLKEISPRTTRAAVLRDPSVASGIGQFAAIQAVAPSLRVELSPIDVRDAAEIERSIAAFAQGGTGGLVVTGSALAIVHRELIVALAARHRLPAVYPGRFFIPAGGLVAYGPDLTDQFRRAASYVDRILKGAHPGDLPVQAPARYELLINLGVAKALGIDVSPTLLARADETFE